MTTGLLDQAIAQLLNTSSSGKQMVAAHGPDWTKWPKTTAWYKALALLTQYGAGLYGATEYGG